MNQIIGREGVKNSDEWYLGWGVIGQTDFLKKYSEGKGKKEIE